jgi:beta-phosphoglucomutase-like phosphatase (HAD superfamily)
VAGTDVERGKPHPDIYQKVCKILDVKPKNALSFEDTQYGLASAKSAGLRCVAIPSEYSSNQDFTQADYVAKSITDAYGWVKNNLI